MNFGIHDEADEEMILSAQHYEGAVAGLGASFLDAVGQTFQQICEFPHAAPVVYGNLRKRIVRGFPYNIIYHYDGAGIFILAIAHQRRKSQYWEDRRTV